MLSKVKQFPESFRSLIGLVGLTIIIFFIFFLFNNIFGPDKNAELKNAENKKVQEKANELIETLPRGVLTFYQAKAGRKLRSRDKDRLRSIRLGKTTGRKYRCLL